MKNLLRLQLIYLIFALGYNVVSYALLQSTGTGLTVTPPVAGLLSIGIFVGACTLIGLMGKMQVHAIYSIIVVAGLIYSGVFTHIRHYLANDLSAYSSLSALIAAVLINVAGSTIFAMSSVKAFRSAHS